MKNSSHSTVVRYILLCSSYMYMYRIIVSLVFECLLQFIPSIQMCFSQRPTFPPGNCLDSNAVNFSYHITFSDDVLGPISTTSNTVEMHLPFNLVTEFEVTITASLPDLNLSGSPYSSNVGKPLTFCVYIYVYVHAYSEKVDCRNVS